MSTAADDRALMRFHREHAKHPPTMNDAPYTNIPTAHELLVSRMQDIAWRLDGVMASIGISLHPTDLNEFSTAIQELADLIREQSPTTR